MSPIRNPFLPDGTVPHVIILFYRVCRCVWFLPMTTAMLCLSATGCGSRTYEARLQETANYFRYLDTLNQNLQEEWRGSGIQVRVPKQFELMPAPPKPAADKAGEEPAAGEEPLHDPRQPDYLEFEIPGLVAAWKAVVDVDDRDAGVPAYVYIASNYPMWLEDGGAKRAVRLHEDFAAQLAGALGKQLPDPNEWSEETFPPRGKKGYVSRKAYTSITLTPDRPIQGVITDFTIYLYKVQDIQIVILTVIPRDVGRRENLKERIALCLETLKVSGEKPSRPNEPGGSSVGF